MAALRDVLANPAVALVTGTLVGVALIAPVLWSSRLLAAGKVDAVLYAVMGAVFGGMLLALGLLFGYRALAESGFVYFGAALVAGFVVTLGIASVVLFRRVFLADDETRE